MAGDAIGSIILVEDNEGSRAVLEKFLSAKGYKVEAFDNAEAAVDRMYRGNSVSLVIADVQLPGMNGIRLAEWVAENEPGLPVLFVTGDPGAVTSPGYIVLAKPVDRKEFLDHVFSHIKMGRVAMGFRACITKVEAVGDAVRNMDEKLSLHMSSASQRQMAQDESMVRMGSRVESIGRAADSARTAAENANTNATNAHTKMDNLTIGTLSKNWRDKLDPASMSLMTVLAFLTMWLVSSFKDDLIDKAIGVNDRVDKKVAVVQTEVKKACDKVEQVDRGQYALTVKVGEIEKGQANLDRKMDRVLMHLSGQPPAGPNPTPSPGH